ncbi:MAG: YeeE/YedE family protein, partial [Methyloceanibacter sp.]
MAEVTPFTPIASTIGGAIIGLAAVLLMLFNGRIAGISGILARLFPPYAGSDMAGAAAFIAGLILAPICYSIASGAPVAQTVSSNVVLMAVAGLL